MQDDIFDSHHIAMRHMPGSYTSPNSLQSTVAPHNLRHMILQLWQLKRSSISYLAAQLLCLPFVLQQLYMCY